MSDTLYERYNVNDNGSSWEEADEWHAQTFTIGNTGGNENHNITSIKAKLYREGLPGTITAKIRAVDASNHPTGADLTSGTLNGNDFTTDPAGVWYEFNLTPYRLSAGTQYAVILVAEVRDTSNMLHWRYEYNTPAYTGGCREYSSDNGATWTSQTNKDYMFEEYGNAQIGFLAPTRYR